MTGHEIKAMSWEARRLRLDGFRMKVWQGLAYAKNTLSRPVTTKELAEIVRLDLLTVRPRVTELIQLGFARCVGRKAHDGVYESVSLEEARSIFETEKSGQMQLPL